MNCRQAVHVFAPSFLGFQMIRLAAKSYPPDDVFAAIIFLGLVGLLVVIWCLNWVSVGSILLS